MKKAVLKEGDVINLKNGMKVYADIPEKFVYVNRKKSNEKTHHEVVVGKVLYNDIDIDRDVDNLAIDVISAFNFRLGLGLTKAEALRLIKTKISKPREVSFCFEAGEFVIVKTTYDGGGVAMFNEEYSNGHHVYCKKLRDGSYDENGVEIDFYQTGSFSAVIEPSKISAVRTLTAKFV
jgi:hypothetical protein